MAEHLADVLKVAGNLSSLVGRQALCSVGLGPELHEILRSALLRAAWLHDIGKATDEFQSALQTGSLQALRHEWASLLFLTECPELDSWLFAGCSPLCRFAALAATLGHHLRLADLRQLAWSEGSGRAEVCLLGDHSDFRECLELAKQWLGLSDPPRVHRVHVCLDGLEHLQDLVGQCQRWWAKASDTDRAFVALVRSLLLAADVAASALSRQGKPPVSWISRALGHTPSPGAVRGLAKSLLKGSEPRPFQLKAAEVKDRVSLITAGCGTGKTAAAFFWASRRASGRRIFFCYPTTGTATQGFLDFAVSAELFPEMALLHSRSKVDLVDVLVPELGPVEASIHVTALEAWHTPITVCTVDQVLGLLCNWRGPLTLFPALSQGAFIFDEVHQYDSQLFSLLLCFLQTFRGTPVLLMSASLPEERISAIEQVLARGGERLARIAGPEELETVQRYRIRLADEQEALEEVRRALKQGARILWVSNQVERCVDQFQKARRLDPTSLCYHSRFRYCDRLERHQQVMGAFRKRQRCLACTTQVCEVSLDISADLLVTDLAPVPALIQRLGRLNRYGRPTEPKLALVLPVDSELPYTKEELQLAKCWLDRLQERPVSQRDLAEVLAALCGSGQPEQPATAPWLVHGFVTPQCAVREASITIPVVRFEDRDRCLVNGRVDGTEVVRYSIPMLLPPVVREIDTWERWGLAFVAPLGRIAYSEETGGTWRHGG